MKLIEQSDKGSRTSLFDSFPKRSNITSEKNTYYYQMGHVDSQQSPRLRYVISLSCRLTKAANSFEGQDIIPSSQGNSPSYNKDRVVLRRGFVF